MSSGDTPEKTPADFERLPRLIRAGDEALGATDQGLAEWIQEHRDRVDELLRTHGALLFRGFGISSPGSFRRLARDFAAGKLESYVDGNSPRTRLTKGVYTSTEYPAQYFISLHNELSYSHRWPAVLLFCCITAPRSGGETVIVDSRRLLEAIDPDVVDTFREKGIRYIRNLHSGQGFGPSWQDTFETTDRAEVEEFLSGSEAEFEWLDEETLRIVHTRDATAVHPETGEEVWFNQADQFHPSTHPEEVYASLMSLYEGREDRLPQEVRFGDGTPIDVEMLDHIRRTTLREIVYFPWQEGDVMVVDNMLVAHGRAPFEGPRKILVSMAGVRSA